ncbi:septum formation initiator family protein [Lachnospiraceae bacterium 45-W7]
MRRRGRQNKNGMLCITLIVLILAGVMSIQIINLHHKNESYRNRQKEMQAQLESEEQRKKELEEYEKYINSEEYIEQAAKTRLGLVHENEIIFKEKRENN